MDSTISGTQASGRRACAVEPEKICVRHIRLALSRQHIRAIVGSFHAADQVLLLWAARSKGTLECEFEIVYDDGHTLAGAYRFQGKGRTRPALMGFVRKSIEDMCEGASKGVPVRGLCNGTQGFLTDYATDDF